MPIPEPSPSRPTLTVQVMDAVRGRIAGRMLAPGARVPSIRAFAREQGVSASTVVEAYERLVAEGVIAPRPGSGFYVAGRPQPLLLRPGAPVAERDIDPLWVMRQALDGSEALKPGCGWLPQAWMPAEAIRRALRAAARSPDIALVDYATPLGFPPLRAQLSRRLAERGVEASPEQILLTDSGTGALDLVCRLLLQPGDTVVVDDPCYFNFLGLARAHRARVVGVPMTPSGPDLDAFERVAAEHRPRLYLTTAALHNPTGVSYGPAVAHRLLTHCAAHDVTVIEDDIFGDLEPEAAAPRLAALDGLARVVQVGSFSKTLSAAIRCGYVAARPDIVGSLADIKLATAFGSNDLSARLVHSLLTDGSYRRHVEGLRAKLARAMGETARHLAEAGLRPWILPKGGLFLWAVLPEGADATAVARRAMGQGVVLAPGNVFSVSRTADRYMRFNVAQCGSPRVFEVLREALAG
ncbi:PLP-dependent aminotransferase family protein [Salinarimonas soli]|uniref:PLP-dependent aminotransferase family protein n=1 Tax=Salinarimonas soli TaxID=1638099 RepID=A0A5B2VTT2_9HYPH|nr:PLP-dependent aminotransferase family protein [Salinarimonas soli]KAA2242070.1 PLP-dependent aminotransferase family protein [Salinarimonas soli]